MPEEAPEAAAEAGLGYVTDATPGIQRIRAGKGFWYRHPGGGKVTQAATLARIKDLVIPPAWNDVWISPSPSGHLQATGRDARGRKQYRYHDRWREVRDETKYEHLVEFARSLPALRERIDADLRRHGLPKEKVVALVLAILESTHIRIGNDSYARENKSFGLTTMRTRHADVTTSGVKFKYRGKSGIEHEVQLSDPRLARIVRRCRELPGQELFGYVDDDGQPNSIDSGDVNSYLALSAGEGITTKEFRTWSGTLVVAQALADAGPVETQTTSDRNVATAIKEAAQVLGNTPAVCRSAYVHPTVLTAYGQGRTIADLRGRAPRGDRARFALSTDEKALVKLLEPDA